MSSEIIIEVYGTRYSIKSSEEPKYVQALAQEIDEMLTNMMKQKGISLNQALLLMSLHYLDTLKKNEQSADHMRVQISEYLKDAATARAELADVQRKLSRLEQQKSY